VLIGVSLAQKGRSYMSPLVGPPHTCAPVVRSTGTERKRGSKGLGGRWGVGVQWDRASLWADDEVLEVDSGDGCAAP
jgi:hypothetical protein